MSCVVIRSKKNPDGFPIKLSEDALRRGREYMIAQGIDVDRIPPLIWPKDAVSAYREHTWDPWQYTTKADIRQTRQKDAKEVLWFKREYKVIHRRAAYVWVFWCPGISGCFEGWWTYITGNGFDHGGKFQTDSDLILEAMTMFPVVEPSLLDVGEDWKVREKWMIEFAKRYQRGKWCGKPQGKAPVWVEVQGDNIEKIIGHAKWPPAIKRQGVKE